MPERVRTMAMTTGRADANGVSFHYLEAGRGPLVLCLHGFPDNAHSHVRHAAARPGRRRVSTRSRAARGRTHPRLIVST